MNKVNIEEFPKEIVDLIKDKNIVDCSCHSYAIVYSIDHEYYLKIDEKDALRYEAQLTQLFHKIGLGVEVVTYLSKDKDYMITKSAIGKDATNYLNQPKELCQILAKSLLKLHQTKIENVPISPRIIGYENHASSIDEWVLVDRFKISSKEEAIQIIEENQHKLRKDTLIHGDACLPNIMIHNHEFTSFIDFNLSGLGDKHVDLYWAIWSLNYNLKTDIYTDYFLDEYGRDNFDYEMLRVIAAFEALK